MTPTCIASMGTLGGQQPAAEPALAKFVEDFSNKTTAQKLFFVVVGVFSFAQDTQRYLVIFCWFLPHTQVENVIFCFIF